MAAMFTPLMTAMGACAARILHLPAWLVSTSVASIRQFDSMGAPAIVRTNMAHKTAGREA
jgi:hypothetical protein